MKKFCELDKSIIELFEKEKSISILINDELEEFVPIENGKVFFSAGVGRPAKYKVASESKNFFGYIWIKTLEFNSLFFF